jgi:threonine dehydrogenase-like Zn-dependent dehydrogenase
MYAAVLTEPRRFEVREVPRPQPGPGQVRVRVQGCGLCGSNVPSWEGRPWFQYPLGPGSPGHEGWGVVDAAGDDVAGLRVGQRVAYLSNSALAEYDLAGAEAVVPLPPALDGQDFPGEPIGCAVNVLRRSDVRPGQTVAVIGVGFLGAVITRLAVTAGARVLAIARRPFALELAHRLGAAQTLVMDDHQRLIDSVRRLTDGVFCDRVIEAVGEQWPLDLAGELTRERGRLVIAGYHQDGPRQVNMQLWNWRGLDVINAHERDPAVYLEGIRGAVEAVATGRLDLPPLLTHRFPLRRIDEAFAAMGERPPGFLKALVTP